jgi:hypothetical protein
MIEFVTGFVFGLSMLGVWLGFRGLVQRMPKSPQSPAQVTETKDEPEKRKRGRPPKAETKAKEQSQEKKGGMLSRRPKEVEPEF